MISDFLPIKIAFSEYMRRYYKFIVPTTAALQEFVDRGIERSILWAPDRLVDAVEEMLEVYRKNDNPGAAGEKALLPVIMIGMAKDYAPANGEWGRQVGDPVMVRFSEEDGASTYGYRQAQGELRVQVVIIAPESATARSLSSQFCLWAGSIGNRRFYCQYVWGQYTLTMPCMIENPDIIFPNVPSSQKNLTMLAGDLTLRITIPFPSAPKDGEPNDGTTNNPPGYPFVTDIVYTNLSNPPIP